jgi:small-conductance mechanosensitive channel
MSDYLLGLFQRDILTPVIRVGVIVVCTIIALRLVVVSSRAAQRRISHNARGAEREARLNTVLQVTLQTARLLILIIALLMLLATLGINIAPLLAGLGVVGLALSLGAQTLIRDMIGGMIILLEDQFDIGDTVKIGTATGVVERMSLRATYLRDDEGRLILIPNGDVRTVSTVAHDWTRATVDISIAVDSDIQRVVQVLGTALEQGQKDPQASSLLVEAPVIEAWSGLTDSAVQVRVTAKTKPGGQFRVADVLRRYSLQGLGGAGIKGTVEVHTNASQ